MAWLGLVACYFGPVWAQGRVLAFGDALNQDLPLRWLVAGLWQSGEVPFWNAFSFSGQPLLASLHVGALFPGNAPFLFLAPADAMNACVMGAVAFAGLGMLALARAWGLGPAAALAGAAAFGGSGFVVAHLENLQIVQAAALVPALLWAVTRVIQTGEARCVAWGAGLFACQVLAGHPQIVVFSAWVVAVYGVALIACLPASERLGRLGLAALVPLAGLGLSAIQLLPALEFIARTQRADLPEVQVLARSLPPRQALTFWLPFMFGGVPSPLFPMPYWGEQARVEMTGYVGLASLALAALACTPGPRRRLAWFWLGVAGLALLLACGEHLTPSKAIARLPLLSSLPAPARHLLAVDLALAGLAALGMERLVHAGEHLRARWWAAVLAVCLPAWGIVAWMLVRGPAFAERAAPFLSPCIDIADGWRLASAVVWLPLMLSGGLLALAWLLPRLPAAAPWLVLGWLLLDLGTFGWHVGWRTRSEPADALPRPAPLVGLGDERVLALYPDVFYPYDNRPVIAALRLPNWGFLGGVRHVGGYDAFIDARYARHLGGFQSSGAWREPVIVAPAHRQLDLLAARWLLLDARMMADPLWRVRLATPRWRLVRLEGDVGVFENLRAMPRAWRVARVRPVTPEALLACVEGQVPFDPSREALCEAGEPHEEGLGEGTAELMSERGNEVRLQTAGRAPGLVVVSLGYDPGWRASLLSGQALRVERVDGCLTGVRVPAGAHEVLLRYVPPGWGLGSLISGLTCVALGLGVWRRRRARA
jgi:hypothetical protein